MDENEKSTVTRESQIISSEVLHLMNYRVSEKFRILHNKELCEWYIELECKDKESYRILVGKPLGKQPLRKQEEGREDNIKMDVS
jgi:hypothetical protein